MRDLAEMDSAHCSVLHVG